MAEDREFWLGEARARAAAGDYLLAYDTAMRGLAERPEDLALKHAAVLALARSGATATARERYLELGLGNVPRERISPSLYVDILALDARILKDLALLESGERRRELFLEAARRYRRIFDDTGHYYPGVNAATLTLLAGHPAAAKATALRVREICEQRLAEGLERGYYIWASVAEASLVAGDLPAAERALREARGAADAKPDAVATTRKQLRLLCDAIGAPVSLLDALRLATVIHYAGHLIGARLSEARAEIGRAHV